MSKRRCTDMVALLPVIESLLTAGMSRRETADKPDPKEIGLCTASWSDGGGKQQKECLNSCGIYTKKPILRMVCC